MTKDEATEVALAKARAEFHSDDVTLVAIAVLGDDWRAQVQGPVAKNAEWRHVNIFTPRAPWGFRALMGTPAEVERKLEKDLATVAADNEIRDQLVGLVRNERADALDDVPATSLKVGDVAFVYAMGYQRRGVVTSVGRSRAEVAYTTAASSGRVFRKSSAVLYVERTPAVAR